MRRLGAEIEGRIGLVFIDGHSDFRHPGNAPYVGAAAGEDLALVTGRGQPEDRWQAQVAGFDAYLVKPVVPDQLFELIARVPTSSVWD